MKILGKARCLRELAERFDLHGLYFQHIALCRRRAWLHLMGATHAVRNARVRRGLALHETDKRRDRVPGGLGIAPDGVDFERRVVMEKKGGGGAREAVQRQALFYAAFMSAATGDLWRAEIQVYGSRTIAVHELTEDMLDRLTADARESVDLREGSCPPARRIPACRSCSCKDLCWDDE